MAGRTLVNELMPIAFAPDFIPDLDYLFQFLR